MTQKKQQVIIIDDEPSVLDAFKRLFFSFRDHWDFTFVDQGEDAWDKIQGGDYSVVVTDVYMPGMNGLELLKLINENETTRDIPVIMITGKFNTQIRKKAMEGGAADLIVKPVNANKLVERISIQLETKNRIDQLKLTNTDLIQKIHDQELKISQHQIQILSCLGNIAESCDRAPGNHIARVGYYSVAIAQAYGWDPLLISQLSLAAPLHDVGKIGIPDKINQKRGKLTDDEEAVFSRHCILGKQILQRPSTALTPWLSLSGDSFLLQEDDESVLNMAGIIALSHHENWNGSGYPIGLKGEEIPLPARIVAYADRYDLLTSILPGEVGCNHEEAVQLLSKQAGRELDPDLLDAFQNAQDEICDIKDKLQDRLELIPDVPEVVYQECNPCDFKAIN
ncbi:MAG: response regulator [Planctomycetia bacterium]|jgi:putative two-component system response regulator